MSARRSRRPAGARCSRRPASKSASFALSPQAGSDAEAAEWVKDWRQLKLAFDHAQILDDAEKLGLV